MAQINQSITLINAKHSHVSPGTDPGQMGLLPVKLSHVWDYVSRWNLTKSQSNVFHSLKISKLKRARRNKNSFMLLQHLCYMRKQMFWLNSLNSFWKWTECKLSFKLSCRHTREKFIFTFCNCFKPSSVLTQACSTLKSILSRTVPWRK